MNKEIIELSNENVTDISIDQLIPNVIDKFIVHIFEGHHTVIIPMTYTGINFANWRKGRGGIFSKDVLNYTLKKPYGKYAILKTVDLHYVIRLIEDEELDLFDRLKLIDGKIKDKSYMIFKKLDENLKLSSSQESVNNIDSIYDEESYTHRISITKIETEDDYDTHKGSISLFND